jgi:hypothetical protein
MAYLKKEKEVVEMDFPVDIVWGAISKVITTLEWEVEAQDRDALKIKAKSKSGFMSYGSTISIELLKVDEKVTRVAVTAETPVTTVTSIVNFGQTARRVDSFFRELAGQFDKGSKAKDKGKKKKLGRDSLKTKN